MSFRAGGVRHQNPLWLLGLPVALCLTDLAATLYGQSPEYWGGNFADVVEGNLVGWVFLRWHPWAFAVGVLFWAAACAAFIRFARRPLALTASLALIVGHTIGTCSWLPRIFSFWVCLAAGAAFCAVTGLLALPTWTAWRNMFAAWLCGNADPGIVRPGPDPWIQGGSSPNQAATD